MKAYGLLGVALVVLSLLGHIGSGMLFLGFLLVVLDSYTNHMMQRDLEQIKDAVLTGVGMLWYFTTGEEEFTAYEEDEEE